jgi:hypothetical protein
LSAYHIDAYGRIFGLTFQALVNDDIGALSDIAAKMTRGARRWFETFLIDTIIRNPVLADGKVCVSPRSCEPGCYWLSAVERLDL